MAKSQKLEELTAKLRQVSEDPTSEESHAILRQALSSKYSTAVAQAARLVGEFELTEFISDLVAGFDRGMQKPKDSDPGCLAKQAIAETLYRLNYSDETLFLKGIRHVQREPVWGGQVDTAARLRGTCALGLVRMNYPKVMVELADLLADPEPEARIGAARAIAYSETEAGIPLLRLRVKVGDTGAVLSECLTALLKLAPTESLVLVRDLLHKHTSKGITEDSETHQVAALALGESRLPEAFPVLRDWWQGVVDRETRRIGLLAIATLRQDEAINFLLSLIAEGHLSDARDALQALSLYRQETVLWNRVCQTVEQRQDKTLQQWLAKLSNA
jgi:HEAT repeat protein